MMVKRIESANILIVEDEPYDAEHLSLHLQQAGHRVAGVVATGEDALLRVAQGGVDLMVVDIVLPGKIDGIETAMQIRQQQNIPAIFVTAYVSDALLLRAEHAHPYAYLLKPYRQQELEFIIKMCITRAQVESNLVAQKHEAEIEKDRLQRELSQAQKMDALGQLTSGIAHDFNNILAIVNGYLVLSLMHYQSQLPEKVVEYLKTSLKATERASSLVTQMLEFSRNDSWGQHPLQLSPVVKDSVKMLHSIMPSSVSTDLKCEVDLPRVSMDPSKLQQLLMNLCINARDAMQGKGTISIRLGWCRNVDNECNCCHKVIKGDWVGLTVGDTGSGMSPETLKHLFEPFYTTKEVGKGTGLGMSVLRGIVSSHGGHVLVATTPGSGTTIKLLFPPVTTEQNEVTEKAQVRDLPVRGEGRHILVVDDEPFLAEFTSSLLEFNGFRTTIVTDSTEALNLFREQPDEFVMLVTDQTMPGISGVELIRKLREIRSDLPIILCSGYSEDLIVEDVKKIGVRYLSKPADPDRLMLSVAELL